jgi:hypothetical protein
MPQRFRNFSCVTFLLVAGYTFIWKPGSRCVGTHLTYFYVDSNPVLCGNRIKFHSVPNPYRIPNTIGTVVLILPIGSFVFHFVKCCVGVQEDPSENNPILNSPVDEYSTVGSPGEEEEAGSPPPRHLLARKAV